METAVADWQLGLMTRKQALETGATPDAIRYALNKGTWQRVLPGVYALFTGELAEKHRIYAAVLYGGESAIVTGNAACRAYGLRYVPDDDDLIRLLVAHTATRTDSAFVRVSTTTRLPCPRLWVPDDSHGRVKPVRLAPPFRAVMDSARAVGRHISRTVPHLSNGKPVLATPGALTCYTLALRGVRALLCETAQRRLATPSELVDELEGGPRRGSALARRAITDIAAGCRSAPECELRDLVSSSEALPPARFNEPLPGYPRLRPDACWPERRLIVEIDSIEWHRWGDAYERTEQRRALLAALGWTVIPVSPQRMRACPEEVLAEIESAYARSARSA